jgi:hypothetical protein
MIKLFVGKREEVWVSKIYKLLIWQWWRSKVGISYIILHLWLQDSTKRGIFPKILSSMLKLVIILVLLGGVYGELGKCYYWVVDGK